MHRIDTSTAQVDKFGSGKNGFTGGNPQTGELPTALDADYFDTLQEELAAVIESAGIALSKDSNSQLLLAVKQLQRLSNANYYVDSGASNTIVITPSPAITALVDGQIFDISCAAPNTGATTIKVNSLSAYPLIGEAGALQGGEIGVVKGVIRVMWSASASTFLLVSKSASGPAQVAVPAKSNHAVNLGLMGGYYYATAGVDSGATTMSCSFTLTPQSNGVLHIVNHAIAGNGFSGHTITASGGTVIMQTRQFSTLATGSALVAVQKGVACTVTFIVTQSSSGSLKNSMTAILIPSV